MLNKQPNKGDTIILPQGVVTYRLTGEDLLKEETNLVFAEEITKPSIAIFVEDFNERVSKLIVEDKIRYVYSEWLFTLEDNNVNQIDNNTRRSYQF